jgi:hypothetical protein
MASARSRGDGSAGQADESLIFLSMIEDRTDQANVADVAA